MNLNVVVVVVVVGGGGGVLCGVRCDFCSRFVRCIIGAFDDRESSERNWGL